MAEIDEETNWIALSRQGDQAAFAQLIQRHQRLIHHLAWRMTGGAAEAEDVAQETFIQAYQHLESYRGESRFSSWLCRIAINRCLTWRDRRERRHQVHMEWGRRQELSGGGGPAGRAEQLQEALLRLPPKQRAAVVLTSFEGLNHAEAARALGCSETTVSWRLFAARAKLRHWLARPAPEEVAHE